MFWAPELYFNFILSTCTNTNFRFTFVTLCVNILWLNSDKCNNVNNQLMPKRFGNCQEVDFILYN